MQSTVASINGVVSNRGFIFGPSKLRGCVLCSMQMHANAWTENKVLTTSGATAAGIGSTVGHREPPSLF